MPTEKIQNLLKNLPDAQNALRFYASLAEKHPAQIKLLEKNQGLLSDVLTIASFSPLLSTTMLQNPAYISWLNGQRKSSKVRDKEELLEALARFALTNSMLETNVLLARFRRRELLRIYLRDIRNLNTIAEITEEISNLADAILEYALQIARQELDNRYGIALETDENERSFPARFCIVALGKLGSKELNYASDIDLLFLYSAEGTTSGHGSRGAVTNREYFVKLSEFIVKLVGAQTGEGAAYRVDMRLRPNGRVGALAISLKEAIEYYKNSAQSWERQVLIRSRSSAGNAEIFREFFEAVRESVFSKQETIENALRNVRLSKEKINFEKAEARGFNVKLGIGGIREIEFIAQALQLAYGGRDEWLRASHTLISLSRLADRNLLSESDLTELSDAYAFLRRLEHRLQMENGLQTHLVSEDGERKAVTARQMIFENVGDFERELKNHTGNVNRIFSRIFSETKPPGRNFKSAKNNQKIPAENDSYKNLESIFSSLEKSDIEPEIAGQNLEIIEKITEISPHFAQTIAANPNLVENLPAISGDLPERDYRKILLAAISGKKSFAQQLAILRKTWSRLLLEIVIFDVFEKTSLQKIKNRQTKLAEAGIEAALVIAQNELQKRFAANFDHLHLAVLGLGKLGGGGLDYDSDLDLVLVYDDEHPVMVADLTHAEFYSRAVEIFVNALSSFTREGHLYRVDLRLRPDGKNGATSIGKAAFLQYLRERAAIWEWLAYVKLRAVGGDSGLADYVEKTARETIHQNAAKTDKTELKQISRRVRERLEQEKSPRNKGREIDIKFGAGGMLDIYFAVRFLQLSHNVPDENENRSTLFMLEKLYEAECLSEEDFRIFSDGYEFITELDHNLRLTVGRSTRLPLGNRNALRTIFRRMNLDSIDDLLERLTFHRLNIRASFENIFTA